MLTSARRPLTLPVGTVERLEVPDVIVGGYPDPTALDVDTQLSAAAVTATQGDAVDPAGWSPATWDGPTTIRTHLLSGTPQGAFGLWVRISAGDEQVIRYAGRVILS